MNCIVYPLTRRWNVPFTNLLLLFSIFPGSCSYYFKITSCYLKVPEFRAPGLRTPNGGAPGLRTKINRGPRAPEKFIKGSRFRYALLLLSKKPNPRIEKIQQFLLFKRCFYEFFSTLLVFRSYLGLFINHDQWVRLIFDSVNDVRRFKGWNFFHTTMRQIQKFRKLPSRRFFVV